MSGSRTEQPTARRLRDARRRGEVAWSAELTGAAALAGGLAGVALEGPDTARELARALHAALADAVSAPPAAAEVVSAALGSVLRLTLLAAVGALACGALAAAAQAGFAFSPEALWPRLERLDPARGLRRLCSLGELVRVALALAKGALLVALLVRWWRDAAPALASLPRAGPAAMAAAARLVAPLAVELAGVLLALGAADLALARRRHRRALMMTRDEVRRELREDEGDPAHRAERRRIHRALLETAPAARATVVVVNPTEVAVALRHERGGDAPPRVLAKGTGPAAARIRSAARRAGVPIVRDVALARALHRLAEVGEEIPEQLYDAAAAVLAHLYASQGIP